MAVKRTAPTVIATAPKPKYITNDDELQFMADILDGVLKDSNIKNLTEFNEKLEEESSKYTLKNNDEGELAILPREKGDPDLTFQANFMALTGANEGKVGVNYSFNEEKDRTASSLSICKADGKENNFEYSMGTLCKKLDIDGAKETKRLLKDLEAETNEAAPPSPSKTATPSAKPKVAAKGKAEASLDDDLLDDDILKNSNVKPGIMDGLGIDKGDSKVVIDDLDSLLRGIDNDDELEEDVLNKVIPDSKENVKKGVLDGS